MNSYNIRPPVAAISHAPDFIDLGDSREELKAKGSRQHHTQLLDSERYRDGTGWQRSTLSEIEHLNSHVRGCVCSTGQPRAPAICHRCEERNHVGKGQMSSASTEHHRREAERARQVAEHERANVEQMRSGVEEGRVKAESSRTTAEHLRVSAEEAREVSERLRRELESVRQEREGLRGAAEEARHAAEEARYATIAAVAATADALHTSLAQMQFLEDARQTLRQLKIKPGDAQ
jgi:hypothetical protein